MTVWKTLILKTFPIILIKIVLLYNISAAANAKSQSTNKPINRHSFVILQYHHVSTETPNSTSVTPETFENHMAFLDENYYVIDLAEAMTKLKNNEKLPDRSVVITFDDGYTNILENAHPILTKFGFPYTIFINPAIIDEFSSQLTWAEVKQMQPLATFANHTLDHAHLLTKNQSETTKQWIDRVMSDINQAEEILRENLGYSKKWLAYPFGEFNTALKTELQTQGYIGFGQQSGGVTSFSDFGALPRFPAAGNYANLDSLETKLNSFAMPVELIHPTDTEFKVGDTLDKLKLQIDDKDVRLSALTCYFKGGTLALEINGGEVIVQVNHDLKPGRERINCTAPSNAFGGRFYWYSFPMYTPTLEGVFLN